MKKIISFLSFIVFCSVNYAQTPGEYDLHEYPFSHYGSYMSILYKTAAGESQPGLFLQDVSGRRLWHWKGIFKIEPLAEGKPIEFKAGATSSKLTIATDKGTIEIAYEGPDIIRFRGEKIGLRLTQYVKDGSSQSFPINKEETQWRVQMGGYDNYVFTALNGEVKGDPAHTVTLKPIPDRPQLILTIEPDENGIFEFAWEQYQDAWARKNYPKPFDRCVKESEDHLQHFSEKLLNVSDEYLADVARRLGKHDEASEWKRKSDNLLNHLIKELWNGELYKILSISSFLKFRKI